MIPTAQTIFSVSLFLALSALLEYRKRKGERRYRQGVEALLQRYQ